jgi:CCR4-NOT transcription complex subunit 2
VSLDYIKIEQSQKFLLARLSIIFGMFGGSQQSGVSDLLLGAGGFPGSLANGFGNDTSDPSSSGASGSAPSGSTAFDLNDFPSLGGGGGSASSGGSSGNNSGNGLAAALRQQQQLLAHQQMLQVGGGGGKQQNNLYRLAMSSGSNGGANFNMATEDFPALPGAPPPSAGSSGNIIGSTPSSSSLLLGGNNNAVNPSQGGVGFLAGSPRAPNSNSGGIYGNEIEGGVGAPGGVGSQLDGPGLLVGGSLGGGLGPLAGLQQNAGSQSTHFNLQSSRGNGSSAGVAGSGSATGAALSGDYGLLGLLGVIRMTDADRNALALGSDLTMLGLNLGASEQIYNTFASPWSESTGSTKEPHYQVCYTFILVTCYFVSLLRLS